MLKKRRAGRAGKGNKSPAPPSSRGVPSDETLWVPHKGGADLKRKGGLSDEIPWDYDDIIDFIFPQKYQPKYYRVACDFMQMVLEHEVIRTTEITRFLKKTGYSKATLENKIIPKLKRFGLLKGARELTGRMERGRPLVLTPSLTFTTYLTKIASEWKSVVKDARRQLKLKHERENMERMGGE